VDSLAQIEPLPEIISISWSRIQTLSRVRRMPEAVVSLLGNEGMHKVEDVFAKHT
jgi:hypothetical protein